MSDYSYCIVDAQPPRPRAGLLLWLLSWLTPISGWTSGTASDFNGRGTCRQEWEVRCGLADPVGILHACGDTKTCRCVTSRQFKAAS